MPTYTVATIADAEQLAALTPEWTALFYETRTPNPFAHPLWLTTWARHFIRPSQLYVLAVRDQNGALVGVAPFYRRRHALGSVPVVTTLQLLGTDEHDLFTELPQILVRPDRYRQIYQAVIHHLVQRTSDWDWVEFVMTPEQGWFEPQWLPVEGPSRDSFVVHKSTRPCVVLPLSASWEDLRATMKRNIKESLRHGLNSLARAGCSWRVVTPDGAESLDCALTDLMRLHRQRVRLPKKIKHPNYFATPADCLFARDAAPLLFAAGHLTPYLLQVEGKTVAAHLLLHANGTTFFSVSGFDPAWWSYNVATTLIGECLRHAIARGDRYANLSSGVDVAKLRWSEQLHLHQRFAVVGPNRYSRVAFALYWNLRANDVMRRQQRANIKRGP